MHRITRKPPAPAKSKSPQSRSANRATSDRVMTDVLLAIKPNHVADIVSRQKNHEYRKYRLRDGVTRYGFTRQARVIRRSYPMSVRHTPGSVPTEPVGSGNAGFNAGLEQSKYGYPILELYELISPMTLPDMRSRRGMSGAPTGWRYV